MDACQQVLLKAVVQGAVLGSVNMCSIFGFQGEEVGLARLFLDAMRHRGPDGENVVVHQPWILGQQRLSIIDVSDAAAQPMQKSGNTIVFNGEIYNYKELKKQYLKDVALCSTSDTEVLLELLNRQGISIVNKLNGMFAFAWYNSKEDELILCRDRFGKKPLYWMQQSCRLYFASEIRPLATLKKDIEFDRNVIRAFVDDTATDFDERTHIKGVWQIRPGHLIIASKDKPIKHRKWYFGSDHALDESRYSTWESVIESFEELLVDSIALRHRADVPVCITLSGGLDSTLIYILAKERLNSHVKPFTFIHPGSGTDESAKVFSLMQEYDDVACCVQSDHSIGAGRIEEALGFLEFPIWNPSAIAYLDTYKAIGQSGFKVVLEGHGSDEQLGGYPYMIEAACRRALISGNMVSALRLYSVLEQTKNAALEQKREGGLHRLLNPLDFILTTLNNLERSKRGMQAELEEAFNYKILPIVLRAFDRLSMSQSLESRSPFLDYRVVEYLRALPIEYKVGPVGSKAIIREVLKKYGKDYLYKTHVKMGFASDLPRLFKDQGVRSKFADYINCFNFEGFGEIKAKALANIQKPSIGWRDIDAIWKVGSLEITRRMYQGNRV